MKLDEKENSIEVCLFESYLAKYFIEQPQIFQPLIDKILKAIEQIIARDAGNNTFNRLLFSIFSTLNEAHPGISNIETLKQSKSIIAFDTFCKYFTENVMSSSSPTPTLFKSAPLLAATILNKMRPASLFLDQNRGAIEIDIPESESKDMGILSHKDTPADLQNYFPHPHHPSRSNYKPNEQSLMTQWLRSYNLPVISGISGGIGITLSRLSSFIEFSKIEYQLLGLLITSSTIALGHHSFFEVIRPLTLLIAELQDTSCLLEFYEQVIPDEIRQLPSYKAHIENYGALIKEFIFHAPAASYLGLHS